MKKKDLEDLMQGELINRDYQKLGHLSYQEIHDSYKRIGMVISTK